MKTFIKIFVGLLITYFVFGVIGMQIYSQVEVRNLVSLLEKNKENLIFVAIENQMVIAQGEAVTDVGFYDALVDYVSSSSFDRNCSLKEEDHSVGVAWAYNKKDNSILAFKCEDSKLKGVCFGAYGVSYVNEFYVAVYKSFSSRNKETTAILEKKINDIIKQQSLIPVVPSLP